MRLSADDGFGTAVGQVCAIVVPIYRKPTLTERFSLDCLRTVLGKYPIFLLKPRSLDFEVDGFFNCCLDDRCFSSVRAYGAMMASAQVYDRFRDYKYILIYQLDCLVFRDDLRSWCDKGYDFYCSACLADVFPWVRDDFVGIGGLSLRSVEGCIRVLRKASADAGHLEMLNRIRESGAEDVFWGRYAAEIDKSFSVMPLQESMAFSFNGYPWPYLSRGASLPPFACHAWLTTRSLMAYYRYLPFREPKRFFKIIPVVCYLGLKLVVIRLRQFRRYVRIR